MTTPDREPCPSCDGRRTIARQVPETRTAVTHPDGWQGTPVSLTYQTGRTVERLFECSLCYGRGTVDRHTAELERIDREKHAEEQAKYAALDAWHLANAVAGNDPY